MSIPRESLFQHPASDAGAVRGRASPARVRARAASISARRSVARCTTSAMLRGAGPAGSVCAIAGNENASVSSSPVAMKMRPVKGSALDMPQSPWLVDAAFSARSARLGPLYGSSPARRDTTNGDRGAQRVQNSRKEPYSGPMTVFIRTSFRRLPSPRCSCHRDDRWSGD